jgi:hypothetical protein
MGTPNAFPIIVGCLSLFYGFFGLLVNLHKIKNEKIIETLPLMQPDQRLKLWSIVTVVIIVCCVILFWPKDKQAKANEARKELANMGLMWNERGVIDSVLQKDSKTLSLYLDGGWKVDPTRFYVFATKYFDNEAAKHFKDDNIDVEKSSAYPEIMDSGTRLYIHKDDSNIPASFWFYRSPDFYEEIEGFNDPNRNAFVQRLCGKKVIIDKIDKIGSLLKNNKNISRAELVDVDRWRKVREFLSGAKPSW